ncbi:MAG TPA: alpha/beta fold hydrolase [Burkholderiaceae bacterium]|nr:alpha/beta fold hydrolase [Burkholderiaceae bacterium]
MLASIEKLLVNGPGGNIDLALDWPAHVPKGIAFIGHPHPLFGGTLDNKVVATIARTFAGLGWLTVRLNFRGVGRSDGTHDDGRGETEDFLHLIETVPTLPTVALRIPGPLPIALAGFSFGTFVAAKAAHTLAVSKREIRYVVLIGAAAGKWPMPAVAREALVIHGELDETIPLASVLEWARPQDLPIVVIPGADHFFHRRLGLLKRLISAHILGMPAIDAASQSD